MSRQTEPTRHLSRYGVAGICLSKRQDVINDQKMAVAKNVRVYSSGEIRPRPGLGTKLFSAPTGATSLHTLRRFNDPSTNAYKFILAASDKIYLASESGAPTLLGSGLSGRKLRIAFARPQRSAKTYAYLTDGVSNLRKIGIDGSYSTWGIFPLNSPAIALIGKTLRKDIDLFDATAGWGTGGTATAISGPTNRVSFAIPNPPAGIIYDTGSTGWANIIPATLDGNFQPGMALRYNSGGANDETTLVDMVSEASGTTTILSITYDSGSTGLCTLQLTTPTLNLTQNSTIQITNGGTTEYCRVIDVISSSVDQPAIRVSTVNTFAATHTITGVRSYRTYLANTHVVGETVATSYIAYNATVGTGYITKTSSLDLLIPTGATSPFTSDDYVHISIQVSDPSKLTELRIELDVDSTTNDFTQNYYFYAIQPSAFNSASTTLTAAQIEAQRLAIQAQSGNKVNYDPNNPYGTNGDPLNIYTNNYDNKDGMSGGWSPNIYIDPIITSNTSGVSDAASGANQWTELKIKLSDFVRVGSDSARGWKDVKALRIQSVSTDTVDIKLDSWYIGGGGLLNTGIGADYNWVIVARNRNTGDTSLPSPPLRSGISISQGYATLTWTQSSDSQITDYDIYRFGGVNLATDPTTGDAYFYLVGSIPATTPSTSLSFVDNFADDSIQVNGILSRDNYPPFPQLDLPRTGTGTISGNILVWASGDTFNTSWAPGSFVNISDSSGHTYLVKLYASPYSTTRLELDQSLGLSGTVTWNIFEPIILGAGLSAIWGPYTTSGISYLFGAGSTTQAGTLFWTNPGSPGTASLRNQLEITSPQEPLVGGCLYDGQCFVMSTERMFRVFATGDINSPFDYQEVANSKGLTHAAGLTVGQIIYFLGKDGLYASSGGQPQSLTDRDLYPIFPHDSQFGETTNGVAPPDYTNVANYDLCHHNDFLYFNYTISGGDRRTLVLDISRASADAADIDELSRWISVDDYAHQVALHYGEEGVSNPRLLAAALDGNVYILNSKQDDTTGITFYGETKNWDFGSPRNQKYIPQLSFDVLSDGIDITISVRKDLSNSLTSVGTINNSARDIVNLDLPESCKEDLSLGVIFSGTTSATSAPRIWALFIEQSELNPSSMTSWYSQPTSNGAPGWQILRQGFITYAAANDVTLTINVDGTNYSYTLPANSNSARKYYLPLCALKGKLFSFTFASPSAFKLYNEDSEIYLKPWGSEGPYGIIHPVSNL